MRIRFDMPPKTLGRCLLRPLSADLSADHGKGAASHTMPREFGKYTLLHPIAKGGTAELILATTPSNPQIIIKRLHPSRCLDPEHVDMLSNEAHIASNLAHPNVVRILDHGCIDNIHYIAMEAIDGKDLRSIIQQMKQRGMKEFPLDHALTIVIGVARALTHIHEQRCRDGLPLNIVHGDISPQNVLVTTTGCIKVIDFGASQCTTITRSNTDQGRVPGTLAYMSPEQARGEPIDHRSDIFSLGIILFELTTSRRLFLGEDDLETLYLVRDGTCPSGAHIKPGYPQRLDAIMSKALAKNTARRYQSARELLTDIETFVRTEGVRTGDHHLAQWMHELFDHDTQPSQGALRGRNAMVLTIVVAIVLLVAMAWAVTAGRSLLLR